MAATDCSVCKPLHTAKVTYKLDRNVFEGSKTQIDLYPSLNGLWKVCVTLAAEGRDESVLSSIARIWYTPIKNVGIFPTNTWATVSVRVRQESDTTIDSVSKFNVPWRTHCSDKFVVVGKKTVDIIPSLKKMYIHFHITWRKDNVTSAEVELSKAEVALSNFTEHRKNLVERLKALSSSKIGDVVFVVGEEEIVAHPPILSAVSEVFKKMFEIETQDKLTLRVKVEDASPKGFRGMLGSLYTGEEPDWKDTSVDDVLELAYLAHKYGLKLLQAQCACRMVVLIQVENVCTLLKAAITLGFQSVVNRGIQCLKDNGQVLQSKEWKELAQNDPYIVIDILTKMTQEKIACEKK